MSFAQLSYREGLQDIEACLNAQLNKLYHMGIKGNVSISNLSCANENRDWRIYADLYRYRWKIELFFKWIKQHLKIKSFLSTSPNAVKTQIWIEISVYVLVAIIKKTLKIELSLYTILQIFSVSPRFNRGAYLSTTYRNRIPKFRGVLL